METVQTPFSSRRPAAGSLLPAFTLPPPTAEVPRGSDGLSPGMSVNTGSSQGSQAANGVPYSYTGHSHGTWPTPSSSYTISSATQTATQPLSQHTFGSRSNIFNPSPSLQLNNPRSSQSPATGSEGLPAPPYDQIQHPFQTPVSGGSGPASSSTLPSTQPPTSQSAILTTQAPVTTHSPTHSSSPGHIDSYTHSRPPHTSSYYTTSTGAQQPTFAAYAPHPSPSLHSPTTNGPVPRTLSSIAGHTQIPAMAQPPPYRYPPYQSLPTMGGSVMSNIHQPGGQMSMIPTVTVNQYGHAMLYNHHQPPQPERPFKCDQCVQSFSRNHDLKRHKRIHLAVKPFPCNFCSKSFSRKDALKRHRLVKGCEGKNNETSPSGETNGVERNGSTEGSPEIKKE